MSSDGTVLYYSADVDLFFYPPAIASTCRPARVAAQIVQGRRMRRKQRLLQPRLIPTLNRLSRRHRCPHHKRWSLRGSTATTPVHPILLRLLHRLRSLPLLRCLSLILAWMLDPTGPPRRLPHRHPTRQPTMECRCRRRVLECQVVIRRVMLTAVERRRIKSSRRVLGSLTSIQRRSTRIHRMRGLMALSLRIPMPTRIIPPTR